MRFSRVVLFILSSFFLAATFVLLATGFALLVPSTPADVVWHLYEYRRAEFMPYRWILGPVFVVLSLITGVTSIGLYRRRRWGVWFGIAIFVDNALGYVYQLFTGNFVQGGIGLVISALLVFALLELSVRVRFERRL